MFDPTHPTQFTKTSRPSSESQDTVPEKDTAFDPMGQTTENTVSLLHDCISIGLVRVFAYYRIARGLTYKESRKCNETSAQSDVA